RSTAVAAARGRVLRPIRARTKSQNARRTAAAVTHTRLCHTHTRLTTQTPVNTPSFRTESPEYLGDRSRCSAARFRCRVRRDERVTQTQACDGHGTVRRRDCREKYGGMFDQRTFWAFSRHHVLRLTSGFLRSICTTTGLVVSAVGGLSHCSLRKTITRREFDSHSGGF
ncbi:unnamed protein product, partial [Ectocarpus sp. 8 AP-2014]